MVECFNILKDFDQDANDGGEPNEYCLTIVQQYYPMKKPENCTELSICILFTFEDTFFIKRRVLAGLLFKNTRKMALVREAG